MNDEIATLEQEARQMRARMDRLERAHAEMEAQRDAFKDAAEYNKRRAEDAEKQRDELLAALIECDEAMGYMSEYDIPIDLPGRVNSAIANAKGGAA